MNKKESSGKVQKRGRARCPIYEYEKSMTYTPVGRAPSPATHYDGD